MKKMVERKGREMEGGMGGARFKYSGLRPAADNMEPKKNVESFLARGIGFLRPSEIGKEGSVT